MALLSLTTSFPSTSDIAPSLFSPSSSSSFTSYSSTKSPSLFFLRRPFIRSSLSFAPSLHRLPAALVVRARRMQRHVVRMAPEEEKMTRRSPLDFPIEWERPKPGRRPDIFPQFSPMKTPLPPPMPADPPEEDEEEEEERKEEEEETENPEREEPNEPGLT